MKSAIVFVALAAAVSAQNVEWNECQQNCLEEGGNSACTIAWNETDCFCSNEEFATDVRHCFYENQCWTDIMPFYEAREERCGDLAEDIDMSGRPGMGGGMGTGDNSTSASASASASVSDSASNSASSGAAATSGAAPSSSISASATASSSASVSADNAATSSPNAAGALVPAPGIGAAVSGVLAVFGVIAGGALLF